MAFCQTNISSPEDIMSFDHDYDQELKNIKHWPNFPRMFPYIYCNKYLKQKYEDCIISTSIFDLHHELQLYKNQLIPRANIEINLNPLQACKIFQFCKKYPILHPITINVYTAQVLHLLALSCKLNIRLILQLICDC